jgi:hypothetical protein
MIKTSRKPIYFALFFISCFVNGYSQTNIKANIITVVGLPHIGVETKINNKFSFQVDVLGSLWKSFNNAPQQFIVVTPELRYHFNTLEKGFYMGGHIAGSKYKMQKWNYINTDFYQVGYSVLYGTTIGFKVPVNEHFSIDIFAGGGLQSGFYNGYRISTGERYEDAKKYNKSGEWLPYRGGVMVVYKLGKK